MSDRDEQWFDFRLGAQGAADDLPVHGDRARITAGRTGLVVLAGGFLRDTDTRQVGEHTQMRGETEAAGMGQPVTVADEYIGFHAQGFERPGQRGYLAEGEKTRDIGEFDSFPDDRMIDHGQ